MSCEEGAFIRSVQDTSYSFQEQEFPMLENADLDRLWSSGIPGYARGYRIPACRGSVVITADVAVSRRRSFAPPLNEL